ncbi:MAG: DNA methylase [Lachnospiraceae bacterium]|nr:DNA methylase [Lachnospiraceae bacterium]
MCVDLKSYYASVEAVYRGMDPLKCNLMVADESRTDKTIVLAVSPALKAIGVPGRPRLFEAKQKIKEYEARHHTRILYEIAPPRMAEYIRVSSKIYEIYRKYVAADDIHVYSIDECFIDVTGYLHFYRDAAAAAGVSPAHQMAVTMIRDVLAETGITATVGIGTNLYLAKVGMDIVAKKAKPDKDGVRIAELDEDRYKLLLWDHKPLTDFWMIGPGTARKLQMNGMSTLGDVATMALQNEEYFYKLFGINAEILLDHVWGIEPCLMSDIKSYKTESRSLSTGQVLSRPYQYDEAKLVFMEMADLLATDLVSKKLTAKSLSFWVSFDPESLVVNPHYEGRVSVDFYGRLHPRHVGGSVRLRNRTNSHKEIMGALETAFSQKVDRSLLIRRLGIAAEDTRTDDGMYQLDLFTDYNALEKERNLQRALLEVRKKYGTNALLRGMNYMEGGTARERNTQIGGHRA